MLLAVSYGDEHQTAPLCHVKGGTQASLELRFSHALKHALNFKNLSSPINTDESQCLNLSMCLPAF